MRKLQSLLQSLLQYLPKLNKNYTADFPQYFFVLSLYSGIGILRKEGYEVKSTTFMKYGVPFTLAAVITGYVMLWLIWA